jgi:hypothetical protein
MSLRSQDSCGLRLAEEMARIDLEAGVAADHNEEGLVTIAAKVTLVAKVVACEKGLFFSPVLFLSMCDNFLNHI